MSVHVGDDRKETVPVGVASFRRYVLAVERVELLLRNVTNALDAAGVPYAVIGGNAVAAWVSTIDDGATRATKDVDLLVRRADMPSISAAVAPLGLFPEEAGGIPVLLDKSDPRRSKGVHLIYAAEPFHSRSSDRAPDVSATVRLSDGFRVIPLLELVAMKLIAYRLHDRVHLQDMLKVGLITPAIALQLPEGLLAKLRETRDETDWGTSPPPQF